MSHCPLPVSDGAASATGLHSQPGLFNNSNKTRPRDTDGERWADGSAGLVKPSSSGRSWAKLQSLDGIKPKPATKALPLIPVLSHQPHAAPCPPNLQQSSPKSREKPKHSSLSWGTPAVPATRGRARARSAGAREAVPGPLPHSGRHRCLKVAERTMREK